MEKMRNNTQFHLFIILFIGWVFSNNCYGQIEKTTAVAGGERHSIALMENGTVWAWGANGSGQLGNSTLDDSPIPVRVTDPTDPSGYLSTVSAIAAGSSYWLNFGGHNLALKDNGTVWAWGYGIYGQLGDGAIISRSNPVQVVHATDPTGFLTNMSAVSAGDYHSLALKNDGTVWAWGKNDHGRLGDGTFEERATAVQVSGLTNVIEIAAGGNHSMALKQDGTVWTWGANPYGELGDGTWGWPMSKTSPVQVILTSDPTGYLTGVVAIAAGDYHSLALKADGTLWAWGKNDYYGQLGDGGTTNQITPVQVVDPADGTGFLTGVAAVAGGDKYTIARKTNGDVWTWGLNTWGQLGDGTTENNATPKAVAGLSGITHVDAGNGHSLAVDQTGKVWTWGANWSGQLGDGTTDQSTSPVQTVFPDEARTSMLKVIGHALVTPGEEVAFLVDYENILEEPLDDCVILIDLPSEFEYASSTKNGIYRYDRHQVFWRLGDVDPGEKGVLAIKVAVQWGIAAHDTTDLYVDIGARNIDTSFILDDYLDHTVIEVTTEKDYTIQEISSLLSTNNKLKRLYDHALIRGYRFDNRVTEYGLSDGSSLLIMMMINPDPFGPVYITVSNNTGYIQVFDENGMTMLDENGGYTEDIEGNTTNTWGTWAESDSPERYKCIGNCIFENVKDWTIYIRDVYKSNKRLTCKLCREAYQKNNWDSQQCGYCAELYANVHKKRNLKFGAPISNCIDQCKANPYAWQCQEGESFEVCDFGLSLVVSAYTAGHVTSHWTGHTCTDGKFKKTGGGACVTPQICRQNGNHIVCKNKCIKPQSFNDAAASTLVSVSTLEDDSICAANLVNHEIMFAYAGDPNAKSVDTPGDVLPGQTLTYTVEYENEGAGTAYGVYILDELDTNLNEITLTVNDNGDYSEASRRLSWEIGELDPGEQGSVTYSVDIKENLPSGTEIINIADVHFPSADETTPTNPVVNIVNSIVANPQAVATIAGTPLVITLTGSDSGSSLLTFHILESPSYGVLSGAPPTLTYTPMEEYSGQDTFTFRVNNGLIDSGSAMVRINVTPDPSDSNPPAVVETYPLADALNLHVSQSAISQDPEMYMPVIKATFSEPLDADTITEDTFTIYGLTGTVAYDEQTRTALFSPSSALAYATTYIARLNGIKDLAGNTLLSEYTWRFTTQRQINIVSSLPGDGPTANFGEVHADATSDEVILSLMNTGPLDLTINSVTIIGNDAADFLITEDNCSGATLTEFENETIKFVFKPLSAGDKQAALSILSNDPYTPDLRIDIGGKGIASVDDGGIDGGYNAASELWVKAVLQVPDNAVTLVWKEVGADITPSGDQVISGYFYADPIDFAYGSVYNPELFVKIYIATNGWCNIAFNHVTVDPVSVYSAHHYAGSPTQTGTATLTNRLAEHQYNGVAIDATLQSSGGTAVTSSDAGYTMTSGLWAKAMLQPAMGSVNLIWKTVGADTTPSGDSVVSGYFYASPDDFAYGSVYNPEVFVKIYIAANGWANIAFNHVTVDGVDLSSAHHYGGLADQSGTATLSGRLVEHQYEGVVASIQTDPVAEFDFGSVTQSVSQEIDRNNGGSVSLDGAVLTIDPGILGESAEITLYAISIPTDNLQEDDLAMGGQTLLSNASYVIGVDKDITLSGPITLTMPIDITKLPENVNLSQLHVSTVIGGFVVPQGTPDSYDAKAGTITFSFNPQSLHEDCTHQSITQPALAAGFPFLLILDKLLLVGTAGAIVSTVWNPLVATIDDVTTTFTFTTFETDNFNITYRGANVTTSHVIDMANALEDAYDLFVNEMEFSLPNLFNFDGQYTIYLDDFKNQYYLKMTGGSDAEGFTLPGSSWFEGACYVNNAVSADKWATIAVHEYFHALQFGMIRAFTPNLFHRTIYPESGWLFEGSTTALSGRVVYGNSVSPSRDTQLGLHLAQGRSLFDPEQYPAPDVAQDFFYYLEKDYGNVTFYRPMFEALGFDLGSNAPTSVSAVDQVIRESDPEGKDGLSNAWLDFIYDIAIENSDQYGGNIKAGKSKTLTATTTSASHSQKLPPLSYYIVDFDVQKLDDSKPAYNQPRDVALKIALTASGNLTAKAIIDAKKGGERVDGFPKETSITNTIAFEETLKELRTEKAGWIRIVVINDNLDWEDSINFTVTAGFDGVSEAGYHIFHTSLATNELKVKNLTSENEWTVGQGTPIDLSASGQMAWESVGGAIMVTNAWGKGSTLDLQNTPECRTSGDLDEENISITDNGRLYYAGTYEYVYTDDDGKQHYRTNRGIVSCLSDGSGFTDVRFDYNQSGGQIDSLDSFSSSELKVAKTGKPIVFTAGGRKIGVVDTSGAGFRWLTTDANLSFSDTGWASRLRISDNGERVIFTTQVNHDHHLIAMSTAGGTPLDLSTSTGLDLWVSDASLSPDGNTVLVTFNDTADVGFVLINAWSGAIIRKISGFSLGAVPAGSVSQFTPDGEYIIIVGHKITGTTVENNSDIFMLKTDGTGLRNLTSTPNISEWEVLVR